MSWLATHLEQFVFPVLGFIPEPNPKRFFTPTEMQQLKNVWRKVKKESKGKKLLLTGRDTFLFEVLARRENYPTQYLPECSRVTVDYVEIKDKKNCIMFDTGFVGTIPQKLGLPFILLSHQKEAKDVQIFPCLKASKRLALKVEYSPKYWDSARLEDGKIVMRQSVVTAFAEAAKLTMEIYRDSTQAIPFRSRSF